MGPVLAFTFGVTLKDKDMAKLGFANELISITVCVVVGFFTGLVWYNTCVPDEDGTLKWPTMEMTTRGDVTGLVSGGFVAAVSGIGVALSVLGEYMSTVIGMSFICLSC